MAISSQKNSDISDQNPREIVQDYLDQVTVNPEISASKQEQIRQRIKQLLVERNAVIVAHYYTDPLIQALAEETGGIVSDSLEMARFGNHHEAETGGCRSKIYG